ncbi:SUKH-4 family immunity protein [Streptomyces sp. NPDC059720]|uniref:SUKH-4 family immunity protein n=1 Tax=Streptomyces sp. NPDC059720 TaxID=3346924 RepID=UPI003675D61E
MRTTDTGCVTITLTRPEPDPWVAYLPEGHWLIGPGLPYADGVLGFGQPRGDGPRTVAGVTGETSATHFRRARPAVMDRRLLTPALRKLIRCAEVTDELAGLRRQFAARAGRCNPEAVAEASRHLLSVFRDGEGGAPGPFAVMAPLIRPLSPLAGRDGGSGLSLDLPHRLLGQQFGPRGVVRFEDVDFPAALTHEPTRRFLREVGLPEEAHVFSLDTDVPLATPSGYHADCAAPACPPAGAGHLIRLGSLVEGHSLLVDGETGAVLDWDETESALRPLTTDVSTLAFALWLLHREQTPDTRVSHALTPDAHDQLAMTMLQVLAAVDPTGVAADGAEGHDRAETAQDGTDGADGADGAYGADGAP